MTSSSSFKSRWRTVLQEAARFLVLALLGILGVFLLTSYWAPARALALAVLRRTDGCTFGQSLDAARESMLKNAGISRTAAASRRVRSEPPSLELWETPQGRFWIQSRTYMTALYRLLVEDDLNHYGAGELAPRGGDVVLDCGAAQGTFVRKALRAGARLVVAIEPLPSNVACLERTFADEIAQGRVIVCPRGVWDKEDKLVLRIVPDDPYDSSLVRQGSSVPGIVVPLTTIDLLVSELKLSAVDYIKMDIEGSEKNALRGAAQTLKKYRPRLAISVDHVPEDPVRVPEIVRQLEPTYREQCRCNDFGSEMRRAVVNFY